MYIFTTLPNFLLYTEHKEDEKRSGVTGHVVAVATTSRTRSTSSYSAGDHISVVHRLSDDVFQGTVHGRSVTFTTADVVFHRGTILLVREGEREGENCLSDNVGASNSTLQREAAFESEHF